MSQNQEKEGSGSQHSSNTECSVSSLEILLDKLRANLGHSTVHEFVSKMMTGDQNYRLESSNLLNFATEALKDK